MARWGDEWIGTFEDALAAEESRANSSEFMHHNPQCYYNYLYFRSGLYGQQITRYFEWFPRDRFLFLTFDQLKEDGYEVLHKICDFLDISWFPNPPELTVHNEGTSVRSPRLAYWMHHRLDPFLKRYSIPGRNRLTRWLCTKNVQAFTPPMNEGTRRALLAGYESDLQKVEELTNLDLSAWFERKLTKKRISTESPVLKKMA